MKVFLYLDIILHFKLSILFNCNLFLIKNLVIKYHKFKIVSTAFNPHQLITKSKMYKKINILTHTIFLGVIFYLAYKFMLAQAATVQAVDKVKLLNNAADNFIRFGFYLCLISLVLVNILAFKTKRLFWLVVPLLFTAFVSWVMSWQADTIFIFTKQNGLWDGGFSLSEFVAFVIVFFAVIILVINYFILKAIVYKTMKNYSSKAKN